jgi:hypothetical protein
MQYRKIGLAGLPGKPLLLLSHSSASQHPPASPAQGAAVQHVTSCAAGLAVRSRYMAEEQCAMAGAGEHSHDPLPGACCTWLTCACIFFRASLPSLRAANILVCCLVTSMLESCEGGKHGSDRAGALVLLCTLWRGKFAVPCYSVGATYGAASHHALHVDLQLL